MSVAIRCDPHTHTLASRHAYSTIVECVSAAVACGLELIGSTDHFSHMIAPTLDVRDYQHFLNLRIWPRHVGGVTVLRGVEVDIVDLEGNLFGHDVVVERSITGRVLEQPTTLKDLVFSDIDYAIASVHDATFARSASLVRTTRMYVDALLDPKVMALGHIGRSGVPFDLDEVLVCARDNHKLIEINEHSFREGYGAACHERCREVAVRAAELGCPIMCGTDAHIAYEVGDFCSTRRLLDEIAFPDELVACASAERLMSFLPRA